MKFSFFGKKVTAVRKNKLAALYVKYDWNVFFQVELQLKTE